MAVPRIVDVKTGDQSGTGSHFRLCDRGKDHDKLQELMRECFVDQECFLSQPFVGSVMEAFCFFLGGTSPGRRI